MVLTVTGFIAGLAHVITGPDHLAAVAPLAVHRNDRGGRIGLFWGFGHTSGVLIVAVLVLLFRGLLPMDLLLSYSERLVGVALLAIGFWGFRAAFNRHLHVHEHTHDGRRHSHIHLHQAVTAHDLRVESSHAHFHTALSVGILHGLGGGSHIFGVLPALALPSWADALSYLAAFGAGAVVSMTVAGYFMSSVARNFGALVPALNSLLMFACAAAAVSLGAYWLLA